MFFYADDNLVEFAASFAKYHHRHAERRERLRFLYKSRRPIPPNRYRRSLHLLPAQGKSP